MLDVVKIKQEKPELINEEFYYWLSFSRIKDYIITYKNISNNYTPTHNWINEITSRQSRADYSVYDNYVAPQHQIYGVYKDNNFFILEEWYLSTAVAKFLNTPAEMEETNSLCYIETLRQAGYLIDTLAHWCGGNKLRAGYQWNFINFLSLWDMADYMIKYGYAKAQLSTVLKRLIKNIDKKVYGTVLHTVWIDQPAQNFVGINTLL